MKTLFVLLSLVFASSAFAGQIPELHKIQSYIFEAPYSCNGSYEKSALFLSDISKNMSAPDLLFNGACGSELYVEASTAGDNFSLISDLGAVTLESVTASKAFNYKGVVGYDNTFKERMPVVAGNTYSVLVSKSDIRSLYVFTVTSINADKSMTIRYAVKSYSIQKTVTEAPGFSWEKKNQ